MTEQFSAFNPAQINFEQHSEAVYEQLSGPASGEFEREEVHKMQLCLTASDLLLKRLIVLEGASQEEINQVERQNPNTETEHHLYLVAKGKGSGEEIVVDPTWQQFLPPERQASDLPKVLYGTRKTVIDTAKRAGVDDYHLDIWRRKEDTKHFTVENWRPKISDKALEREKQKIA